MDTRPGPEEIRRALAELLTTEGVAELVGVTGNAIRLYRARGDDVFPPPDARIGRTPVWFHSTIETWIASRG